MSPRKPNHTSKPTALSLRQRWALEEALRLGVLVASSRFDYAGPVWNAFYAACRQQNRPFVKVLYGQRRSGAVDVDVDYVSSPWAMTDEAVEEIERICLRLASISPRLTFTCCPEFVVVHHVPTRLVPDLLPRLLAPDLSHLTTDPEKDCGCLIPPSFSLCPGSKICTALPPAANKDLANELRLALMVRGLLDVGTATPVTGAGERPAR